MYGMSCCYVTLQYTLFHMCVVCYEQDGGQIKNPFCGGGLDILWNDTININDAHIFLIKYAGKST